MMLTFDTLKAARRLQDEAGFNETQASVLVSTIAQGLGENLVTKGDLTREIAAVRGEIAAVRGEICGDPRRDLGGPRRDSRTRAEGLRARGRHGQRRRRLSHRRHWDHNRNSAKRDVVCPFPQQTRHRTPRPASKPRERQIPPPTPSSASGASPSSFKPSSWLAAAVIGLMYQAPDHHEGRRS